MLNQRITESKMIISIIWRTFLPHLKNYLDNKYILKKNIKRMNFFLSPSIKAQIMNVTLVIIATILGHGIFEYISYSVTLWIYRVESFI